MLQTLSMVFPVWGDRDWGGGTDSDPLSLFLTSPPDAVFSHSVNVCCGAPQKSQFTHASLVRMGVLLFSSRPFQGSSVSAHSAPAAGRRTGDIVVMGTVSLVHLQGTTG